MSKILTIEDDRFLRELIKKKLLDSGFEAEVAVDGEAGVEKAKTMLPNLILLDLILPGIDGFEVLRQIKQNPKTKDIPVIVLSNLGQQEDIGKASELGAAGYLIKAHFTPSEILDKIREVLNYARAPRG